MLKHYNYRPFRLALPLLSLFLPAMAVGQEWQWAKFGGSNDNIQLAGISKPEQVTNMATDPEGNVFVLSPVGISSLEVDGLPKQSFGGYAGGFATVDQMISSFACDGTLRWAKVIGGPGDDSVKNIQTDADGNVYATGYLVNHSTASSAFEGIHFDEDHVVEYNGWNTDNEVLYIFKYSNDGELQWVHTPQPPGLAFGESVSHNFDLGFVTDPQGNSYWLCMLAAGTYGGSYVNPTAGTVHMLKYDAEGNFIGGHPLDAEITGGNLNTFKMARNHKTGVIYIAGYRFTQMEEEYVKVDGQTVTGSSYIAAFNSNAEALWLKQNTAIMFGYGFNDITLDDEGNIYLTGASYHEDTFGGVSFNPSYVHTYPVTFKLDAEGNTIWGSAPSMVLSANFASGIAVNGNEVWITGGGVGITWGGYQVGLIPNQGDDIYIYKFNAQTGQVTGFEQIASNDQSWDRGTALTAANGAYYLGASFAYHVTFGGHELYTDTQQTDFLVAKYGTGDCYCASPEPSFNVNPTINESGSFLFEYTGNTEYSTINWYFGNEGTSTEVNPTYTFTDNGTYEVCVTVSNLCGNIEACQQVNVTAANPKFALQNVQVYPNPADNILNINTEENLSFEIVSLLGAKVMAGEISTGSQQVDLQNIASGVYMLRLQSTTGANQTMKLIVK
jgi:PKD repeat protein